MCVCVNFQHDDLQNMSMSSHVLFFLWIYTHVLLYFESNLSVPQSIGRDVLVLLFLKKRDIVSYGTGKISLSRFRRYMPESTRVASITVGRIVATTWLPILQSMYQLTVGIMSRRKMTKHLSIPSMRTGVRGVDGLITTRRFAVRFLFRVGNRHKTFLISRRRSGLVSTGR